MHYFFVVGWLRLTLIEIRRRLEMKRKFKGLLGIFAVLSIVMTGCSQNSSEKPSSPSQEIKEEAKEESTEASSESASPGETRDKLVFVNFRDIRDLNPHLYAGEMYAQEMLYETLVNITESGYEGCLAEDWSISDDGKVYIFKIRQGVKFSDGEICDANAIKANFDAIIENKDRHTWLEMMHLLESVEAAFFAY